MARYNRRQFVTLAGATLGGIATGATVTAAESADRYLVETKGKKVPTGVEVVHEMPGVDFVAVEGPESSLQSSKAVKGYAPDVEITLDGPDINAEAPTLDAADYEGPLDGYQWDKEVLNVDEAFETTEGEGTRVSVIDSGVLETHPDLAGPLNLDLSRNFTDDGGDHNPVGGDDHGTHVAGIVAADNSGGIGVNGTAPKTDLVDCRVFSGFSEGASFADILAAIVYSANIGSDVANLSLGAYPVPRQELGSFYGKVLNSTMTYANKEGTLLVIAAGNDGANLQNDGDVISLPNEGAQGLSVASTGPTGYGLSFDTDDLLTPPESPSSFTNYGTNAVTLGAPGGDFDASLTQPVRGVPAFAFDLVFNTVFSVDDNGNKVPSWGWKAGTSMAAPQVAGAAALVKSANPSYNANQVEAALKRAAEVPDGYDKAFFGSGFLNVGDAL